ncbi:MAG: NUDIX hydrolase [Gammaproteobacteria bacterium]|nr:MAG: NUDIX hydrolase [Gammaproteobacteria bacterium]
MTWTPHVTVATLVEKDSKFLIVEEICNDQVVFSQPAGHVEQGETLIQAAIRETHEETGWNVTPTGLLGFYTYTSPHNQVTYYRTNFIAQAEDFDESATLDDGILRCLWLSLAEIRDNQHKLRSPIVLRCVEDYASGQRFPLGAIYEHPTEKA